MMKKAILTTLLLNICFIAFGQEDTTKHEPSRVHVFKKSEFEPFKESSTSEYAVSILTTSFVVPAIRFNFQDNNSNRKGTVSAFSTIGAGVAWNAGRLTYVTDHTSQVINADFRNTIGFQIGVLFSASSDSTQKNVFAPTVGINVLNFNIGFGYELGDLAAGDKPGFITIAYNISLANLANNAFHIVSRTAKPVSYASNAPAELLKE